MNSLLLCLTFNFLTISQSIDITESGLHTVCENAEHLIETSTEFNIDPFVYASLIYNESRWLPNLTSPVGACGLSQVMPKYIKGVNCNDLFVPKTSIYHGAKNLKYWVSYKNGSIKKALQCYATGYKCKYPSYAKRVLNLSKKLKNQYNQLKDRMKEHE